MNKFKKIFFLLLTFIMISIFLMPLQVNAVDQEKDNYVLVKVTSKADIRLTASKKPYYVTFINMKTQLQYGTPLYHYNNYSGEFLAPPGDYTLLSAGVYGDYDTTYITVCDDFKADGQRVDIVVTIGDITYDGPVEEGYEAGIIDREETDRVQVEKGYDPIDWDAIDNDRVPILDPDTYGDDDPEENPDGNSSDNPDGDHDNDENENPDDNPDENPNENETGEIGAEEGKGKENKYSKTWTIIFVVIFILVCGIILYIRYKNAEVFEEE